MRVVLDTNVIISATFFGGIPLKILDAALEEKFIVCGNGESGHKFFQLGG